MPNILVNSEVYEIPESTLSVLKKVSVGAQLYWNRKSLKDEPTEKQLETWEKDFQNYIEILSLISKQLPLLKLDWTDK